MNPSFLVSQAVIPSFKNSNPMLKPSKGELTDRSSLKFKDILTGKEFVETANDSVQQGKSFKREINHIAEGKVLLEEIPSEKENTEDIVLDQSWNCFNFAPVLSSNLPSDSCQLKEEDVLTFNSNSLDRLSAISAKQEIQNQFKKNEESITLNDFAFELERENGETQADLISNKKATEVSPEQSSKPQMEETAAKAGLELNKNKLQKVDEVEILSTDENTKESFNQIKLRRSEGGEFSQNFAADAGSTENTKEKVNPHFKQGEDEAEFEKMFEEGQSFKETKLEPDFKTERAEKSFDGKLSQKTADSILGQLIKQSKFYLREGKSSLQIQLKPENLGRVTLQLVMEEGAVSAKFAVENQAVKQVLQDNFGFLRQSLEQQGFSVEKIMVNVNEQLTSFLGQYGSSMEQGGNRGSGSGRQHKFSQEKQENINDYNLAVSFAEQIAVQGGLDFKA